MDKVSRAVVHMLENIGYGRYTDHPYYRPFVAYASTWKRCIPLKTIVIGQNPYPSDVYPGKGAALAYRPSLKPPVSVVAVAGDLVSTGGTERRDTIECLANSWELVEQGVLMINHSIFGNISENASGVDSTREMEEQIRVIQVMMHETVKEYGNQTFTCIAMGNYAHAMAVSMKAWCNGTTIKLRVLRCLNPAAVGRKRCDMRSQAVTLESPQASKALSCIVEDYMSTRKNLREDPAQARARQAVEGFRDVIPVIEDERTRVMRGATSLMERLRLVKEAQKQGSPIDLDDFGDALRTFIDTVDSSSASRQLFALQFVEASQNMMDLMRNNASKYSGSVASTSQARPKASVSVSVPRPRVSVSGSSTRPQPSPIEEADTPVTPGEKGKATVGKVAIGKGYAAVVDDDARSGDTATQLTGMSQTSMSTVGGKDMTTSQAFLMKAMASAIADRMGSETVAHELRNCASTRIVAHSVSGRAVLGHIVAQLDKDESWDPTSDADDEDSDTYKWVNTFVATRMP